MTEDDDGEARARLVADELIALLPELGPVAIERVGQSPLSVAYRVRWAGLDEVYVVPHEDEPAVVAARMRDGLDAAMDSM